MDHDQLFKELLTRFFAEFLDLFAPDVAALLDSRSFEFLDKETFAEGAPGERREADLVVKARFRDGDRFFLIHIENQSASQAGFARRMFFYFARLHEKYGLPVYPIAILTFDAPQRAEPDTYRVEFPGFVVNAFHFRAIQLNRLNWRDFLRHPNPVAGALMAKMRIAPEDRPRVKLECLRMLATLRLDRDKARFLSGFVDAYLKLNDAEQRVFQEELRVTLPQEEVAVLELTNEWIEEGRMEGRVESSREVALRLARRRFGANAGRLEDRINAAPADMLYDFAEALFDLADARDAEEWLRARH